MPSLRLYIINAFIPADSRSALGVGNPAAVILLSAAESCSLPDATRQSLATELNVSDTAFVSPLPSGAFSLRWFTPVAEVALCGHATLAAAHALREEEWISGGEVVEFETERGGTLRVRTTKEDGDCGCGKGADGRGRLAMRLPLLSRREEVSEAEQQKVLAGLGVGASEMVCMFRSDYDVVVEMREACAVAAVAPDMGLVSGIETRGVVVAAREGEGEGFVSRFFAPRVGIDEDAATGSAQCVLAGLFLEDGEEVTARQLSRRGGVMRVRREGDEVVLKGWVGTVMGGEIQIQSTRAGCC